nr:hypothetical protein [Pandoravirus aubagnensis]
MRPFDWRVTFLYWLPVAMSSMPFADIAFGCCVCVLRSTPTNKQCTRRTAPLARRAGRSARENRARQAFSFFFLDNKIRKENNFPKKIASATRKRRKQFRVFLLRIPSLISRVWDDEFGPCRRLVCPRLSLPLLSPIVHSAIANCWDSTRACADAFCCADTGAPMHTENKDRKKNGGRPQTLFCPLL